MTAQPRSWPYSATGQRQAGLVAAGLRLEAVAALHHVPAEVEARRRRPARRRSPPRRPGRRRRSTGRRSRGRSGSATGCAGRSARSRAAPGRSSTNGLSAGIAYAGVWPGGTSTSMRRILPSMVSRLLAVALRVAARAAVAERDVEHPVRPEHDRAAVVVGERLVDVAGSTLAVGVGRVGRRRLHRERRDDGVRRRGRCSRRRSAGRSGKSGWNARPSRPRSPPLR